MRMWQGMKHTNANEFTTERQANYFRGAKRHHWSFIVGNVEIGSGSHEEKKEAFRLAADDAMRYPA
uniref:DRBM domain-containing protein n=1 Tax=Globisporangium ultimum (strain ATCC 200006 / CBS 805.95 / DAOM BR144) TaxID=431595 RepID=K3X4H9_GLOUD